MSSSRRPEHYAAAILILLLACVAPAVSGRAQGPTDGALQGRVVDGAGHGVAGSQIVLRSLETGEARAVGTQADGSWLLPHLAPGRYSVSVVLSGFATQRFSPVSVVLGETRVLAAALRPVAEPTAVDVQPDEADTAPDAGVEGSISGTELTLLPSAGLRWQDFALTQPGVAPDQDADGLIGVHGLPSTQNSVLVDGADATQGFGSVPSGTGNDPAPSPDEDGDSAELTTGPSQGLARGRHAGAAYSFSQAAVREFRVATPGYSAQTGRAAGAVITTVSRSGAAQFHGSLATTLRSSALAAKNPLSIATSYRDGAIASAVVKPHDLRYNFAASLGGPVPRVRGLRFFYTADVQRRGFPAIASPADPNFYRLTAIQQALLATRGLARAQVNAGLNYLSSLTGPVDRRADQTIHFGRLDWQWRPRLAVGAEWNRVRWNSPAGLTGAPVVARARASFGNSQGALDTVLGRVTATLTARTVNEVRFAYGRDLQFETPQPNLPQEPAIGPPAQPGGAAQAPEVVIGPNGLLFGTPADVSRQALPDENRFQLADTLTLARGHHLLELGGDAELVEDRIATQANSAGTFRYDSGETRGYAGGLVDFLTDYTFNANTIPNGACPSIVAATHLFCFRSFSQSFGLAQVDFRTAHFSGFVEDTWQPRPRLSLHAGLRYDYTLLPIPQRPNGTLDAIFAAQGATSIFPEDRNNFGPRLSFAWQPPHPGVGLGTLRGGYGLFYGRLPGATVRAALSDTALPTATTRLRITPAAVTDCPQVPNQGFGYPCDFLAMPTGTVANTASAVVFDRHFRLPAIQQGSLSWERPVAPHTSVSVGGVLNLDRQLPTTTDLNIAPSTRTMTYQLVGGPGGEGDQRGVTPGETFVLPFYTARVTPNFGPVTQLRSSANASYFGLVVSASSRVGSVLAVRGNYTWAKAIDYGASASATPRTNAQLDPFANGYDKGRSALDYPHLAHAALLVTPHPELANALLQRAARDWEIAALVSARSGRPYTYDLFGGTRLNGGHTSLNGTGGALYLPTVGRNTLRLPAVVNVDLRVARTIALGSRLRLRASVEAFNLFNHRQVGAVVQRAYLVGTTVAGVTPLTFQDATAIAASGRNSQAFGTPTASGSSLSRERHLQFHLRVDF